MVILYICNRVIYTNMQLLNPEYFSFRVTSNKMTQLQIAWLCGYCVRHKPWRQTTNLGNEMKENIKENQECHSNVQYKMCHATGKTVSNSHSTFRNYDYAFHVHQDWIMQIWLKSNELITPEISKQGPFTNLFRVEKILHTCLFAVGYLTVNPKTLSCQIASGG